MSRTAFAQEEVSYTTVNRTDKFARRQLYDYYGTGAHFFPAMYSMLGEMEKWSPDHILNEARKNGLI